MLLLDLECNVGKGDDRAIVAQLDDGAGQHLARFLPLTSQIDEDAMVLAHRAVLCRETIEHVAQFGRAILEGAEQIAHVPSRFGGDGQQMLHGIRVDHENRAGPVDLDQADGTRVHELEQ
ncbi:MAG: hypothetical protein ACRYG8_32450 [Janthinobacterium lividum]